MPIKNLNRLDCLILQLIFILFVMFGYIGLIVYVVLIGYKFAGPVAFSLPIIRIAYIVAYYRPEGGDHGLSRSPAKNQ